MNSRARPRRWSVSWSVTFPSILFTIFCSLRFRRQRLLHRGRDVFRESRVGALMTELVVVRQLRHPFFTTRFGLRIRAGSLNRARVRINDAVHQHVQLLERSFAL